MDPSHGPEVHYHLARAIMHLNTLAGYLPFFEPAVDWDEPDAPLYRRPGQVPPHARRHLHTFVPAPTDPSIPTLASHAGMPSHMVVNPVPHFRPIMDRRDSTIESHQGHPFHRQGAGSGTMSTPVSVSIPAIPEKPSSVGTSTRVN